MAKRYLLPCECGHKLVVESKNAGSTTECPECSTIVDVPKLGELKKLAPAEPADPNSAKRSTGANNANPVKRLLFTLGLAVAVIAGVAGGVLYNYSGNLIGKDEQTRSEIAEFKEMEESLADATAAELWDLWYGSIEPAELPEWKEATWNKNYAQGTILRNFAYGILGVSGIGLLVAISSFFIGNKKS